MRDLFPLLFSSLSTLSLAISPRVHFVERYFQRETSKSLFSRHGERDGHADEISLDLVSCFLVGRVAAAASDEPAGLTYLTRLLLRAVPYLAPHVSTIACPAYPSFLFHPCASFAPLSPLPYRSSTFSLSLFSYLSHDGIRAIDRPSMTSLHLRGIKIRGSINSDEVKLALN